MSDIFPAGLQLTGGIPIQNQDLAASIIFAAAFLILLPLAIFRLANKSSRCLSLIRPTIFIVIRIASFIIRAVMSKGNYSTGLFIAEQIMLLTGFILLCEPLITLVGYQLLRTYVPTGQRKPLLQRVQRILQTAMLVALVLGIYAGSQYGSLNNFSTLKTVKSCRDANVIICIVITALSGVIAIMAYFKESPYVPLSSTLHLVVISALLAMSSIYKIVFYFSNASPIHVGTKIGYYCLSALPELLATALYLAINLNDAYDIPMARQKQRDEKKMKKGVYNGPGYDNSGMRNTGIKMEDQSYSNGMV